MSHFIGRMFARLDCHFVSGSKRSPSCVCLMKSGRIVIKIRMQYCKSSSGSTAGGREMSERLRVSAWNARKGSSLACVQRCHLSRLLRSGFRLRLMGPLSSSPHRCIVLQQTLVAMVSCVLVMKSEPGEGYQLLQKEREGAAASSRY